MVAHMADPTLLHLRVRNREDTGTSMQPRHAGRREVTNADKKNAVVSIIPLMAHTH